MPFRTPLSVRHEVGEEWRLLYPLVFEGRDDFFVMRTGFSGSTETYFGLKPATVEPPATLDCTVSDPAKVQLNWSAVTGATGFKIFRDTKSSPIATVGGNVVSYDDTSVADFLAHTYWVQTVKGASQSAVLLYVMPPAVGGKYRKLGVDCASRLDDAR